jgi:hypothetical protein
MFVGRINKENPDVSRFTVDLTEWLDDGEIATSILTHTITLGTTGWSNTPFPVPGAAPPYDPTPLLFTEVKLVDGGTGVEVYVSYGTPGNVYTCQFEVVGTTLREVTFEVGVQISGQPPAAVPVVTKPIPLDALSIYGGTMLGPLYLFEDPVYPSEAATKQYADYVNSVTQTQVLDKVNRAGDNMSGFLSLYADPVQPLQAATKNYVDVQTGSTLHDAPNDGTYYGRRNLAWAKVVEEAPTGTLGYLRSNGAWARGVFQSAAASVDVRVTDNNTGNTPTLSGMQTPFSAATDFFNLAARRTSTGAIGDGGVIQLIGPTSIGVPNGVNIYAGTRAAAKTWSFAQDGSLGAPGAVSAAGTVTSNTGRIMAHTTDGSIPSLIAYDQSHNVASGLWVGSTGTIRLGSADGTGLPVTTWTSVSSSGVDITGTLSTTANASVGTSLSVGTSISAASLSLTGALSAASMSLSGTATANVVNANSMGCFGTFTGTGAVNAQSIGSSTTIAATTTVSGQNVWAAGTLYAVNADMVVGAGANGRIVQMFSNFYWNCYSGSGRLDWVSNGVVYWSMDAANNHICYNNLGVVGGMGNYVNLASSAQVKTDIVNATQGLEQVLALVPKTYRLIAQPDRVQLGFIIEDVQTVLPEAVTSIDFDETPTLGISDAPVIAAMVNAIKELHARIQALEE